MTRFLSVVRVVGICLVLGAPALAQTSGTIVGRVVDEAGSPAAGVSVYGYDSQAYYTWVFFPDANGEFSASVRPGSYFLETYDSSDRYAPAIYGTTCPPYRCSVYEGAPVVVTAGATTNVTITVPSGARIVGRVFDAVTTQRLTYQSLRLYDAEGFEVSSPRYDAEGNTTFQPVLPGRYHLLWTSSYAPYVSEFSDGRHCGSVCALLGGTPFEVRGGETVVRDLHLDPGGRITGRLTDAVTGQIPSVDYVAESLDGSIVRSGSRVWSSPDPNAFEITGLPPGRYIVRAQPWSSYDGYLAETYGGGHVPCAGTSAACLARRRFGTPVDVAAGATTPNIDIAVDRGGSIAGSLIVAGPLSTSAFITVLTASGVPVAETGYVTAPGAYTVRGLPPGRYFACVRGPGLVTQAYGGLQFTGDSCAPSAGREVVVSGTSVTTGIDFTLTPAQGSGSGSIEGTVRSAGTAVRSAIVALYRKGQRVTYVWADADGRFRFSNVGSGTYHLRTEVDGNFIDEWYGGVCAICDQGFGTSVSLPVAGVVTGIDFDLAPGGGISGTLNTAAYVSVFDAGGRLVKMVSGSSSFSVHGLPSGTYYVRAEGGSGTNLVPVVYGASDCSHDFCRPQDGTPVVVTAGTTTAGIHLTLPRAGIIRGRAVAAGVPITDRYPYFSEFRLQAYDTTGRPAGLFQAQSGGVYEICGLAPGTYFVRTVDAQSAGFAEQTYRDMSCAGCAVTSGTPIHVTEGRVTGGIDFILQPAGFISGTLRDAATLAPLENVSVQALSRNGTVVGTALSTFDGSYVIRGLPPASYYVAVPDGGVYVPRRYTSPTCVYCNPAIGDRVAVSATTDATGIDIYLQRGGRILGRATRTDGAPLRGIAVSLANAAGTLVAHALTDANGAYIATVPAGTYFARAQGSAGFRTQMFNGINCPRGICNAAAATALTTSADAIRAGVDFPLQQCTPPAIGPTPLPSTMVGTNYNAIVLASQGVAPYGFVVASGSLPPGVSLDPSTGVFRGVVTVAGQYQFTVGVTDSAGCGAAREYTVLVGDCRVTPSTTSVAFTAQGGSADIAVESSCEWRLGADVTWVSFSNIVRGAGGSVRISVPFNSGAARAGFVSVGSARIAVRQAALTSTAPFGRFDLPLQDGVQVSGSMALGGWALDDVQVTRVTIYRDSVPPEPPGQLVYIGNGVPVRGARPDVVRAFPTMPNCERAGWGYLLLTNMLPNGGNGTFRLHAFAVDVEGHQTLLGSRTIVASNRGATAPFGAIDTPAQGGTISGTNYVNFGWALTPMPKSIPADGSTITVYIDSLPIGTVDYGHFRGDIANLFPGLANSLGAVGFRMIDTTRLAEGVHTIAWVVVDDNGDAKGIGSRYFTVANEGISALTGASKTMAVEAQRTTVDARASQGPAARAVAVREMDHVTIDLARDFTDAAACAGSYDGYEDVRGERRPLPVGSSLDAVTGRFGWQPGPGFVGTYRLVFERRDCVGNVSVTPVEITISPKH